MNREPMKVKLSPVLIIMILVCSGLFILIQIPKIPKVQAASYWSQTSESEFINGTCENITLMGDGEDAELCLQIFETPWQWSHKTPLIEPSKRHSLAMAPIYGTKKVLLFGGIFSGGPNAEEMDDIWIYDYESNNWTEINLSIKPGPRMHHAMASIYGTDKVLLFGGYNDVALGDTWIYDLSANKWSKKSTSGSPSVRMWHEMDSIYGDDKVLLFGGVNGGSYDDTWVYDLSDNKWTIKNTINKPHKRYGHAIASNYGTDKFLLFGGLYYDGSWTAFDDTWEYDLSDNKWTEVKPQIKPSTRYGHGLASILNDDKVLLFGGSYTLDDTWIYDFSTKQWVNKNLNIHPTGRYKYAMASVYGTLKILFFGGAEGYGPTLNETWTFDIFSYMGNGTYTSASYYVGPNSSYKSINWSAKIPNGASIKLKIRSANTESELYNTSFVGPNGSRVTFYSNPNSTIWSGHNGETWIQYKVYFSTSNNDKTPILKNVTISYNKWPNVILVSPGNCSITNNNKPLFIWNFIDSDSIQQSAFQVVISNDSTFNNILYCSGEQDSTNLTWQFPNGTNYTNLIDGIWYWKVRTKDNDGDWGLYSSSWKIEIDTKAPNSTLTLPINDGTYNSLTFISGIAFDTLAGTGVNKVDITIKQLSNNQYWNGFKWTQEKRWLNAVGTTEWLYDASSIPWSSGTKYSILSRATDVATNIELLDEGSIFTFDTDIPSSIIINPIDDTFLNNLDTILGSAIDIGGAGINNVTISIKRASDNNYWNGTRWILDASWLDASTLEKGSWSYNASNVPWSTDTIYIIGSRAIDKAGNMEFPGTKNFFKFDDQPPTLSIFINNGDKYTISTSTILSLQAEDSISGVSQMSFSTDGIEWSDWEVIKPTKSFELPVGDGEKIIYFKVLDNVGNIGIANDTIILDTMPPYSLSININNGAKETNSILIT